jgi:hypothetical protein
VACTAVGLAFWGGAFVTAYGFGWSGALPGWMLDVGTAIGLAGLLFWLERRFSRSVIAVGQRVERAEERFEERAEQLSTRLDQLGAQFRDGVAAVERQQDDVLAELEQDVAFETVTRALEAANDLEVLAYDCATVQASPTPDALVVEFRWMRGPWPPSPDSMWEPTFTVTAVDRRVGTSDQKPSVVVTWKREMSAAQVGVELEQPLRRPDSWNSPGLLDWELAMGNLVRTLRVAIESTRPEGPGTWRLHGPLLELVGEDWALTMAGIEHRREGLVVPEGVFPEQYSLAGRRARKDWQAPERPGWVAEDEWIRLIRLGRRRFRVNRGLASTSTARMGMTSDLRRAMSEPNSRRGRQVPQRPNW